MGDEPDLDPDINKDFFKSNILELEPSLLTEAGIKCFERFFKTVNIKVMIRKLSTIFVVELRYLTGRKQPYLVNWN